MAQSRFSQGPGPSQRQLRVGESIRRALAEALQRGDVHDPELNRLLITVSEVRASPDLKVATAFVLPLGGGHRAEALAALNRNRGELKRAVSKALTLKFTPELRFMVDETFDRLDDARRIFSDDKVQRDLDDDDEPEGQ